MKRKIGFIALATAALAVILFAVNLGNLNHRLSVVLILTVAAGGIVGEICLAGDVIRFIGKSFSQGANEGHGQECSRVCPLCGKPLSSNARFCSDCGCELTKNS